jgi:pimeloyl-ACP methyl ester carboxylesterase
MRILPGGGSPRALLATLAVTLFATPVVIAPAPASAEIAGRVLHPATVRVKSLPPHPAVSRIRLGGGVSEWHGRLSHLAGTAHYDRGEWIYEDYPESAYGAALPGMSEILTSLGLLAGAVPSTQRLSGALAFVQGPAGAGPFVSQADLSELRFAVRGSRLYVLARTTAMTAPVRTALLILFDTGRAGPSRAVPFGSGLHTARADTAVLVTGHGARIADLVTGRVTNAPARADASGYVNAIEARLPLRRTSHHGTIRMVAAAGVVTPGSFTLAANGQAGPLAKALPRLREPVQAVYDRAQAVALAAHDIDRFVTTVSVSRMRHGVSQRVLPGPGYNVRTVVTDPRYSREGGTTGVLRQYGLYVPRHMPRHRVPATVMLRGSSMTAHSFGAISPNLFRQLGDENRAVVISPGGRSGFDLFEGATYRDVNADIRDAERLLPIDRDRLTVAGYSMGGYGAYMFAATQPDRFAAAFAIEGPVGGNQPATAAMGLPDVIPALTNLRAVPVEIYQGDVDANVPFTNGFAAAQRLRELGYRYRFDVFPGHTHFTHGIIDDYSTGASLLADARRDAHPALVHFVRDMAYERAVDTGGHTDLPTAGRSVGLRFDHAWFIGGVRARHGRTGTATVDVRSFARRLRPVRAVQAAGLGPASPEGELPTLYLEQRWVTSGAVGKPRNAFRVDLAGTSRVVLDLADMGLRVSSRIGATLHTDGPATVTVRSHQTTCRLHLGSRGTRHIALAPNLETCPG